MLVWLEAGIERLGDKSRDLTDRALVDEQLAVSAISFWEIAMLIEEGRLRMSMSLDAWRADLLAVGLRELAGTAETWLWVGMRISSPERRSRAGDDELAGTAGRVREMSNRVAVHLHHLLLLTFVLLVVGCAGGQPAPKSAASVPSSPADATEAPMEMMAAEHRPWPGAILWARTSAEHQAIVRQTYRLATDIVEEAAVGRAPGTWAVSVDADETVIDNSIYNIELWERGVNHSAERFFEWARRIEAPPMPGALEFLERVHELGGKIIVITNRRMPICDVTREDLVKYGIPFDLLLCRPSETESDKTPRYEAVQAGTASPDLPPLEIVLWVGDAIGDFPNSSQELRHQGDEAFAEFGRRYLLLPNPVYGNWASNPEE